MAVTARRARHRSVRRIAAFACAALLLTPATAVAEGAQGESVDGQGDIATRTTVTSVPTADLEAISGGIADSLRTTLLDQASSVGLLFDDREIVVGAAGGVGLLAARQSLDGVLSFDHTLTDTLVDGALSTTDETMSILTIDLDDTDPDERALALGPGAGPSLYNVSASCYVARGSQSGNEMQWCFDKDYLDGGNGRRSYGSYDDDGSSTRDYYLYERSARVVPSNAGADYYITDAVIYSYPTSHTASNKNPYTTGWEPDSNGCGGDRRVKVGGYTYSVSIGCYGGGSFAVSRPANNGAMKIDWGCSGSCPFDPIRLEFELGIQVTQGEIPYWVDDNRASFRLRYSSTSDSIND